ncbi:MAG: MerR family transcriptional regulator [Nocardioidaceae bacterium]
MSWSIVEVGAHVGSDLADIASLRRDRLAARRGVRSNGYRYYEQDDLLRLQQILVLRELDLALREIAEILDRQRDPLQALRRHHQRLLSERDRLGRVARTVARTIGELASEEGAPRMAEINRPENLFEGFDLSEY